MIALDVNSNKIEIEIENTLLLVIADKLNAIVLMTIISIMLNRYRPKPIKTFWSRVNTVPE